MEKELTVVHIRTPETATNTVPKDARLAELLNQLKDRYPTLAGHRLVPPETGDDGYAVSFYGTGNTAVVDKDGTITQPLEDMQLNLYYRITNTTTGEMLETDNPITVIVGGKYADGQKHRPKVLPAIREWKGNDGSFVFSGRIVCTDARFQEVSRRAQFFLSDMLKTDVQLSGGPVRAGDIVLQYDGAITVGQEGYCLDIEDVLTVRAVAAKGVLYAGATITQMLMQSRDKRTLHKGLMRDYPRYPYRGLMIDVARYHMDLDFLEEVSRYAGFFKLNHIHLHLNDGGGETTSSFRVKSDRYPALNSGIVQKCEKGEEKLYQKEAYIAYQEAVSQYGIEVVSEIDTPSHSSAFCEAAKSEEAAANGYADLGLPNGWKLDLRDGCFERTLEYVQSVIDEFIDGPDPVFRGAKLHVGTDEWLQDDELEGYGLTPSARNEYMRKYMDRMLDYVNAKGYTPIIWNGMNVPEKPYGGETPISNKGIFQMWAPPLYSDLNVAYDGEYPMINSHHTDLYTVPGVTYYKNDLDIREMFDCWEAGTMTGYDRIPDGHPLLLGGEPALWMDKGCGCSHIDTFKILKNQMMIITEKTWYGPKADWQSADEYMERVEKLANYAPGANPGRYVETDAQGMVADFDFTQAACWSGGHSAVLNGLKTEALKGVCLNGEGYISTSIQTVCDPYTAECRLYISSETGADAIMLDGRDGTLYVNYEGRGEMAFVRKGYTYIFRGKIPVDRAVDLTLSSDGKNAYLSMDGAPAQKAELLKSEYEIMPEPERLVTTFQLPLEKIGGGVKGYISRLKVYR